MRSSALIIRAFDGSKRQVISEIDLPIWVGPHLFTIMFQVIDINPAYSCLLGRPWIHVVREVASTLHQKLKFMVEDKLVIISDGEDMFISEFSSFQYVKIDEGPKEVCFHCLEFDNVNTTSNLDKAPKLIMSSLKSSKETPEKGKPCWLGPSPWEMQAKKFQASYVDVHLASL